MIYIITTFQPAGVCGDMNTVCCVKEDVKPQDIIVQMPKKQIRAQLYVAP